MKLSKVNKSLIYGGITALVAGYAFGMVKLDYALTGMIVGFVSGFITLMLYEIIVEFINKDT